jgi:hypothetical protein
VSRAEELEAFDLLDRVIDKLCNHISARPHNSLALVVLDVAAMREQLAKARELFTLLLGDKHGPRARRD